MNQIPLKNKLILACALAFSINPAEAAPVGIGIQFGQFGISGYPNNVTPGYQTSATGTLSDGRTYASPLSGGSTNASVGFAALTLSAQHTSLDAALSNPFTYVSAYFADTVTIDAPGLAGLPGSLTYSFTLDGPLVANGAATDQEIYVDYGWGAMPATE
jgi:hypothetical protein